MSFLGGLILNSVDTTDTPGMGLIHVGFIFLFMWAMVIPHEFGHAIVARILGLKVFRVIIGYGRPIFLCKLLGFKWEFRSLPIGGVTVAASPSPRFYRLRLFLMVLAGPLVDVSFAVVAFWLSTRVWDGNQSGFWQELLLIDLALANIVSFVSGLWPRKIETVAGFTANDGLLLCTIPFISGKKLTEWLAGYYVLASQELHQQKYYAQAVRTCEAGMARYPDCGLLRMQLGVCLIYINEFERARESLMEALKATDIRPEDRLILLSNIALADILSGRNDLLEEADRYSAQAYQNIPWVPGVKDTRGMVLVESGQLQEGLALLRTAIIEQTEPEIKATIAAYMAIGEKRRGNIERATRYLDITRTLAPQCRLLNRVKTELELTDANSPSAFAQ
ncbi:MAG: site-2 protease family protein [Nitrospirota bacterium]